MYQKPLPTLMTAILPRPSVRLAQTVQCRFTGEPLHTTETLIEREVHSLSCDTGTPKNKAANGFLCTQQIQTANQVQQNRSRRRKLCGRSLSLTCESKPCDYFQICATRTSRATALILRSTITAPNSAITSKSKSQAI
jgi:hypothetical protein